ncbi:MULTISPECIES: hypothetical protein [Microvirga]|uniref:hypothetical protein n=1 Tax=Microvirga TaxID=186650 RepID=UPI001CFFD8FA|nr:hypothetical protein [Microvirga lenta]MCB5175331.1 hypothetical protein [Microvirga lenta]
MSGELGRKAGWAVALLGLSALAGCGAPGEGGSTFSNMLTFAGPTVPPPVQAQIEDVYCPPVEISEGGAALRSVAGGDSLRSQISLGNLARECIGQPNGTTIVKIGVEGRVLLGPGGSPGRYDVPVRIAVKNGSKIIANRSRRVAASVPAGDTQTTFSVIEEGIVVSPADANSFEIEVGLGSGARG